LVSSPRAKKLSDKHRIAGYQKKMRKYFKGQCTAMPDCGKPMAQGAKEGTKKGDFQKEPEKTGVSPGVKNKPMGPESQKGGQKTI